ncbi:MAG: YsnF/AvaK domain-containing protein [Pseudomonadota bacterium]
MENTVVAVYDNYADAKKAYETLIDAGFSPASVQVNPPSERPAATTGSEQEHTGIRHFFRSLFGMDEDKEQNEVYAESVRRGSYVLTAHADSEAQADLAVEIMNRFEPVDIDERATHWRSRGWSGYDETAPMLTADEIEQERRGYAAGKTGSATLPVIQEELKVGKRAVQRGGVRIYQRVSETPVNESITLREEEITIERHPVDHPASEAEMAAFKEGSMEMTESAEEAVVSKTARVVEEVVVGKEVHDHTETIKDSVRRTDVEVEKMGVSGAGGTMGDDRDFRTHWQTSYGSQGGRYEDYDDAYRYGYQVAGSDRYRNRQWSEMEPDLRGDWESRHPGSTWEKVKDAVRYGAERVTGRGRS